MNCPVSHNFPSEITFERVQPIASEIYKVYGHFMEAANPECVDLPLLTQIKVDAERQYWHRMEFFLAIIGEQTIGTIAYIKDDPENGIPFEKDHSAQLDLSQLRRLGNLMEVCLFSISKKYQGNRGIHRGLLKSILQAALENKVSFLCTQSAENRIAMYKKLGFVQINANTVLRKYTDFPVILAILNLARDSINCKETSFFKYISKEIKNSVHSEFQYHLTSEMADTGAFRLDDKTLISLANARTKIR